ncbi:5,10-methylenetetrahydrofolate reductase [Nocardioides aurantiacus]|uniref:Methylenetetrahydrofolate reductase n=2 Tax=Nocardioides aurantiacus TaxID=86796 RepID=A0A3N2CP21_9ACTN|nr:5,10-methylenetetrahydrofolate reductase [Nocardioides aurantiacus]
MSTMKIPTGVRRSQRGPRAQRATREQAMRRLLEHTRYEVLPTATTEDKVLAAVPTDVAVTVTASPGKGLEATLTLSETLAGHGYAVVPHLAARMVRDHAELVDIRARLRAAGISAVFVPGGDAEPAGDYTDAFSLLEDLATLADPFTHVGIAGYPESHPTIADDLTVQAMWDKRRHATHVVSNLTFDAATIRDWVGRMRLRGITMPLLLGMPGPIDRAKLLTMATKIGVGESTRFLAKHKGTFARLAAPGGFTGERFLRDCATVAAQPTAGIEGLHVFTFNQVAETEAWRQGLLSELP